MRIEDFNDEQMDNLNNDVADFFGRGMNGEITFESFDGELLELAEKHGIDKVEMALYIGAVARAFGLGGI